MTTVNYDRAVAYYDETRAFRSGVAEQYRQAILPFLDGHDNPRILELAIGTGLIGASFFAAGDSYVGVDISRGMMGRIASKLDNGNAPDLAQADIARRLPFTDDSFDLVHALRVFHLLDDWQRCIQEVRRVLKPGRRLLIVRNAPLESEAQPPWAVVHGKWDEILAELGVGVEGIRHGIFRTDDIMMEYLRSTGAKTRSVDLLPYTERAVSPRMMVERRRQKMFSSDWHLPADLHARAVQQLNRWLETDCAQPDELRAQSMVFRAIVARWAEQDQVRG
ncbi:MAG: class I SAM-dependent methyltransferase [Chloroflexi bacterium]|nr:class I SAM-dependent methyltransferase [Chloroflexota bacterium]